jgi:cyclic pyranopterin phosphate synthase
LDLRRPLREGKSKDEIKRLIVPTWRERRDRGAEERLEMGRRVAFVQVADLRRDPHLEMHTRGG